MGVIAVVAAGLLGANAAAARQGASTARQAASANAQSPAARSAAEAVAAALVERLGEDVDVRIESLDVNGDAAVFREARLHPSSRLGHPIRVTLVTTTGASLPAAADVVVTGDRVITTRAIEAGESLAAEDLQRGRTVLSDIPLRRLPGMEALVGARALRALPAGSVVVENAVAIRRAVEPGDTVTVVAAAGAVEVTATFIAADGGDRGAVIRVVNPETRRYLRGRIRDKALIEVIDGQ